MNNSKLITITKEDFANAISQVTLDTLKDPKFEDKPEASMLFCLGGMAFAKQIMMVLFNEEESEESEETAKVHFKEEICYE